MSRIKQSKEVLSADFKPRKVIFNTQTYTPYILNNTAAAIWDFCQAPKSQAQILAYLCRRQRISAAEGKEDIVRFIKELRKNKLILER